MAKFDRTFNIMLPGEQQTTVEGRFTKLKGYSGLIFFSHKRDGEWHIREFYTGRRIGSGETEADAKLSSRDYLKMQTDGNKTLVQNRIDIIPPINFEDDDDE